MHDICNWLYFCKWEFQKYCKDIVLCSFTGTEDCSSKNATAEPATNSNDDLSVNSASGNRTSAGGTVVGSASIPDETRGDLSTVTRLWFGL